MYDKNLSLWAYNPSNLGSVLCALLIIICGINIKVHKHWDMHFVLIVWCMPYVASVIHGLDRNYDEFDNFYAHSQAVLSICCIFSSSSAESNPSVYQHIWGRGLWLRPELDLCFVRPSLCFSLPLQYFHTKHCSWHQITSTFAMF